MKLTKSFLSALVLASLAGSAALAEETAATAATTSTATARSLSDQFSASFLSTFYGPSVANPISDTRSGKNGESKGGDAISFANVLRGEYKFENGMSFGPNVAFGMAATKGSEVALADPYLRLSLGQWAQVGNLSFNGDIRYYIPVTTASVTSPSLYFGKVRTTQGMAYKLGTSIFSLENTTYLIGHIRGNASAPAKDGGSTVLDLILAPALNAQVMPTVAVSAGVEQEFAKKGGSPLKATETSLTSGVSWDVTPAVNLNPGLEVYTSRKEVAADIFVNFSWKML